MNSQYVGFFNPMLIIGVIAGLATLLITVGFWWWWPKREIGRLSPMIFDSAARANAEDNIRKTIGQLLGGAAVLLGAALAYLQFTKQQEASQQQFLEQQQASRDLMVGRLNSAEPSREPATIRRSEAAGDLVVLIDRFCPLAH
jgi:uncharacterized iron-regulated membrane protein